MISSFILNEKHKIARAKLVKKQQIQKEKELKKRMMTITPQQLLQLQNGIHQLSKEYERQANHCCGVKDRFITTSTKVVEDHNKREAAKFGMTPPTSSSAPPPIAQASVTAPSSTKEAARETEEVAPEETKRAMDNVAPEEIPRATTSVVPEEFARVTASVTPDETCSNKYISSSSNIVFIFEAYHHSFCFRNEEDKGC
nr:110 kDa antigen-like [Aegilops tauschii subsp. strangulata]